MKSNVSFLRRLGAVFYDAFLVFSLVFFVMGVIIIALFKNQAQISELLFYTVTLPVTYFYFSLSWVKGRQTLGMKAWKFQVTQASGENITQKQALIRFIFAIIGIVSLSQWFNKDNLALHDWLSKTILIKK
ncbi:RDD family protein [Candidatus Thioglobus sp.]|jgi:RDD family.|uniref:RDD family protein n=1 Tax=Candidatus Thioglobus sp. TaxID=2026721 RepID=UPI001756A58A|nr:RDD family protein [Candidatus Thioglobus sp.]